MGEREVAITSVIAGLAWGIGLALIAVGIALPDADAWADLGLYVSGVGGVLSIRKLVQGVVHARQDVFDMGRDYQRGIDSHKVRTLR